MWTPATRRQHSRDALRYQTDLTDDEWRLIEPYLPPPNDRGRKRSWPLREIVNAIFYVMRSGCPWRLLPSDFPPWRTVYRWFHAWRDAVCSSGEITHWSWRIVSAQAGRRAPRQRSRKRGPRGYDAGKKLRKRHVLVDTSRRALQGLGWYREGD